MKKEHLPYGFYERYLKRALDIVCAFLVLFFFWGLYMVIAVLVKAKLGSPVLFAQERPGKDEEIFKLYKFRSMSNAKDKEGNLLPDRERLTKFGRFLRSTSLDELPEIFNILKGDMSIIGPRPLAVQYLPYYQDEERHRHDVRPGLTGLAQVNGRNAISWEERFRYDLQYVHRITFMGDLKIVFLTVKTVFCRSGIGERGVDSLEDFDIYRKCQREGKTLS